MIGDRRRTPAIDEPERPRRRTPRCTPSPGRPSPAGRTRGSAGRCRRASPVEISATTTPMTAADAAEPERRHDRTARRPGSAGVRSVCAPRRGVAVASARARCRRRLEAAQRRRRRPGRRRGTTRASTTASQRGHSHPKGWSWPPQLTTSGARAMSGTVCDTTRYGSRPRRTTPKRAISVGQRRRRRQRRRRSRTAARRNEYHAPRARPARSGVSDARLSGSNSRPTIVPHVRHRVSSDVAGRMSQPSSCAARSRGRATCRAPTTAATSDQGEDEEHDLAHRSRAGHRPGTSLLGQRSSVITGMTCSP